MLYLEENDFSFRLVEPLYNFLPRKLIGTPLVTCLSKDAKTGADIRSAVCTLLSPLLRAPNHTRTSKVNGYSSSLDGVVRKDDSNTFSSDAESSNSLVEIEEEDDGSCSFQLTLTEEKGNNRTLIDDDSIVFPGPCIRVLLEWSDKINELYDFNYLVDLPEVHKSSGDFAKERQQEAITLFSCLDTFLKEEPLGPDDMWLAMSLPSKFRYSTCYHIFYVFLCLLLDVVLLGIVVAARRVDKHLRNLICGDCLRY